MHWRSRFRRSWSCFESSVLNFSLLQYCLESPCSLKEIVQCSPRSKKNRSGFYEPVKKFYRLVFCSKKNEFSFSYFFFVICVILPQCKPFAFLELVFLQFKGNSINRWQTSALLKKTATFLLLIKFTAKFYFHHLLLQVVKNSQDLGHRQILDAQTYGNAKELATDYQKTKSMLYKRLQETGYGSWDLMKKPPELSHFN